MSCYYESDFVGSILPSRMAPMKIPIRSVWRSITVGFGQGVTFNFFEGYSVSMFQQCSLCHVPPPHDEAAKSFCLGFEEIVIQKKGAMLKSVSVVRWCSCECGADEAWFDSVVRVISNALACCSMGELNVFVAIVIDFNHITV